jgi:hypothetical protein
MKSSWAISHMKWLKVNNVFEAITFSNFKTLLPFHYLTQLMAQEDFTEQKIHHHGYEVGRLSISHLITDAISFVNVACIQRLFFTLPDQ